MIAAVITVSVLLGAALAPACSVLIDRMPRRESLRGAPLWHRPTTARDRVVVVLTATAFGAVAARFSDDWVLPAYLVFAAAVVVVSVIDLEHYLIPNRIVYPTLAVAVPLLTLAAVLDDDFDRLLHAGVGAAGAWLFLLVVHLVNPRAMGFGDVRLAAVLGLFLGWLDYGHVALGMFLGFLLGAVAGVVLMAVRRRSRRDPIPFGPFLAAGAFVAVLVGDAILDWYV